MGSGDAEVPDHTYTRTVGGFYLDRFEVTIGRFAAFAQTFGLPTAGRGGHPRVANSGWQPGWESFDDPDHPGSPIVPSTAERLVTQLSSEGYCSGGTWGNSDQTLPVSCVSWYVAFAFCVFDGGRLPTEAEWNYAAAFGSAHRPYPWSQSIGDLTIDLAHAVFDNPPTPLSLLPSSVGTHAPGRGGFFRYAGQGHDDLAGNIVEWTLDQWSDAPPDSCADCVEPWTDLENGDADEHWRVVRGGGYLTGSNRLRSGSRTWSPGYNVMSYLGFRCARDMYSEN